MNPISPGPRDPPESRPGREGTREIRRTCGLPGCTRTRCPAWTPGEGSNGFASGDWWPSLFTQAGWLFGSLEACLLKPGECEPRIAHMVQPVRGLRALRAACGGKRSLGTRGRHSAVPAGCAWSLRSRATLRGGGAGRGPRTRAARPEVLYATLIKGLAKVRDLMGAVHLYQARAEGHVLGWERWGSFGVPRGMWEH